jgi:hypothetical protein
MECNINIPEYANELIHVLQEAEKFMVERRI